MAIIRIKRSTGTTPPSSLQIGEIAVTIEQAIKGTYDNNAGRLYVGNAAGAAATVGGEYFVELLNHEPSVVTNNSGVIVGNAGTVTDWNVVGFTTLNNLGVSSDVSIDGNLTVVGSTILDDLTLTSIAASTATITDISGDRLNYTDGTINGFTTTGQLVVNDDATVGSALTVSGAVSIGGSISAGIGFTSFIVTDDGRISVQQITNYGFIPDSLTYVDSAYELRSPVGLAYTEADKTLELFDGIIGVNTLHAVSGVITTLDGTNLTYSSGIITTLTVGAAGTQYQLPTGAGSSGQILKMNADGTTSSFVTLDTRLDFQTDDLAGTVGLGSETWDILGTANQIQTNAPGIGRTLTIALTDDVTVGGALTVSGAVSIGGSLTVQGNMTYLDSTITQIQDKKIEIAYSDAPEDINADGGGISIKGDSDYEIIWSQTLGGFTVNQDWFPLNSDAFDLGSEGQQWRSLFVSGTSELTDATIAGVGTIQTVEINAGTINNTTVGASGTSTGDFTDITFNDATSGGTITIPTVDTTDLDARDIEATGVATVATLRVDIGPAVNAVAYAGTGGFVGYSSAPSAGISSSHYLLTSVGIGASNTPVWTDTIDCGTY
ncbi:hypothetical protein S820908_077 [Synechococcus phage S-CAM9]|uniref:Major tropism determinant N-terminal domain-containing protein n=1 Tax=Synechococcus phage S-CAM9 TaxID=1883369 RepID=A0A1D8KPA8_9CAUD|nr:hypothetical protein BOW85_gp171 [Synechococcus phage S-CAM9]AOV60225.1 hypothetical protein S050808_078 [Synechococcus phage S-CAM9]AOV60452.1 hypothetical protein S820908_077 [Synechococcus phage S-CAM9]AOV60681.1 hypothetical protein N161109_078 [Synechococcus phage S-CAM9]